MLSGVDIKVQQLPAGQLRVDPEGAGGKKKRKARSSQKKKNSQKKDAVLQGAKVTVHGPAPRPAPFPPLSISLSLCLSPFLLLYPSTVRCSLAAGWD
jgi:hypothetical protein